MYTKDHFLMRRGQVLWGIVLGSALLGGLNGPAYAGDREDVSALVQTYATRSDQSDPNAFRVLFVRVPKIQLGTKGPMAPDTFFIEWEKRLNELKSMGALRRQHITTLVVDNPTAGKASATASLLTTIVQNNQVTLADSGSVIIDAVKTSRGWKIKALQIVSDTTRLDTIRMERTSPTDGNKKP